MAELDSIKRLALADLERGVRLTLAVQDDIDPQFRFASPIGDLALAVTFPEDALSRRRLFNKVKRLCAWKQVLAYTMTFGISEPNALMTVAVSAAGTVGCLVHVTGERGAFTEASFGEPRWVSNEDIDPLFSSLLPEKVSALSNEELKELEEVFGKGGLFPVVHLASGTEGL